MISDNSLCWNQNEVAETAEEMSPLSSYLTLSVKVDHGWSSFAKLFKLIKTNTSVFRTQKVFSSMECQSVIGSWVKQLTSINIH